MGLIHAGVYSPHIREIYALNLRMFTSLFLVLPLDYMRDRWTDFDLNTSYDAVLRKEVLLGG